MDLHVANKLMFMGIVAALINSSSAFMFADWACDTPAFCYCSYGNILYCQERNLTQIPPLKARSNHAAYSSLSIYLNDNQITSIPAHAFGYLQVAYSSSGSVHTRFYIDLDNNLISSVDANAFAGLENSLHGLVLSNNQLTSIPSAALENLTALEILDLAGNPLTSIDFSSMARFSWSLTEFGIDLRNVNTWPADLSKLQNLTRLTIEHIPLTHLPLNAFAGFESNLQELRISNSKLAGIPTSVCRLPNLYSLQFENNGALESNFSTEVPCSDKMTNMLILYLGNNRLSTFPNILSTFPSLQNLVLDDNTIRNIDASVVPSDHGLHTLYIRNNKLARIPLAINMFKHLANLSLDGNQIASIKDDALSGLTQLTTLQLNDNPIEYISPHAFQSNSMITALFLSNTKLQMVPGALLSLPHLHVLILPDDTIECTCKLSYMKGWQAPVFIGKQTLTGDCKNQPTQFHDGIREFLVTSLRRCS